MDGRTERRGKECLLGNVGLVIVGLAGLFNNFLIALIAAVIIGALQGFVYTFVSPKIMSSSCNIHPVLTLLCLTAGGALGGLMGGLAGSLCGMLLAIPFVAVFKALFVYYYEKRTGLCIVSKDGFFFAGTPYEKGKANPLYDALAIKPGKKIK